MFDYSPGLPADQVSEEWVPCEPGWADEFTGLLPGGDLTDDGSGVVDGPGFGPGSRPAGEGLSLLQRLSGLRSLALGLAADAGVAVGVAPSAGLTAALVSLQEVVNVLAPVDAALIAEVDRRGVHLELGCVSVVRWVGEVVRVRPAQAKARVQAALATASRVSSLGEALPPLRSHVAAAQVSGVISADHAGVVDRAVRLLPPTLDPDTVEELERTLVEYARTAEPGRVAALGRVIGDRFDPDGREPVDARTDRLRELKVWQRDDGLGVIRGVLAPEILAAVQAVLSPLAAPVPSDPATGVQDTRRPEQRNHDALGDAMMRLLACGTLPDCGGVPVSISVIIDLDDLTAATRAATDTGGESRTGAGTGTGLGAGAPPTGPGTSARSGVSSKSGVSSGSGRSVASGIARTEHGGTVPVARILRLAAECEYIPVVLSRADGIVSYGVNRRCAPPGLAKALRARDGGCTFPGCDRPAAWTERHHIVEHHNGGLTCLSNLTLVCRFHHHTFDTYGWTVIMTDGRPWWVPPATTDPSRTPRRNTHWDRIELPAADQRSATR